MTMRLYDELVGWYWLLDPTRDHHDEAKAYRDSLFDALADSTHSGLERTLLELGSGAGNNAFFLKPEFRCTLVDLSPAMLGLSKTLNPECEHVEGDMRAVRLGKTFDAVLVHDAVMYMRSRDELAAAIRTAFAHLRDGGAAVFAPDAFLDTFVESARQLAGREGERALEGLEWSFDPDPADELVRVDYALMLREGASVRVEHDTHLEGLFAVETWHALLEGAGFTEILHVPRPVDDAGAFDEVLVARK